MDFEAEYPAQPGIPRTAELKGKISNAKVCNSLLTSEGRKNTFPYLFFWSGCSYIQ